MNWVTATLKFEISKSNPKLYFQKPRSISIVVISDSYVSKIRPEQFIGEL